MAYKFAVGTSILSGGISPMVDGTYDLGAAAVEWKDAYFDGVVYTDALGSDADPVAAAYISGGEIDGVALGGETACTALTVSGSTIAISDTEGNGTMNGVIIGGTVKAAMTCTTATVDALTATANLDIGAFEMRALTFESDIVTGTAPFTVASTTLVTNLNADKLDSADWAAPAALGSTTPAAVSATTLSASSTLQVGGTVKLEGVADTAVAMGADSIYFRDSDGLMKRDTIADFAVGLAGTPSLSGLVAAGGELGLAINDLVAETTYATGDLLLICDVTDNGQQKITVDNFVSKMAGAGLSATAGVLSSDASPTPTGVGNAAADLVQGFNYGTTTFDADRVWTLPNDADLGDVVTVKAPLSLAGFTLTIEGYSANTIDGDPRAVITSDAGAVTLTYVVSGSWKIS